MSIERKIETWDADTRRHFLRNSGLGLGWLAAMSLLDKNASAEPLSANPLAPKKPPKPATAKSVISLFMQGGPSHMDTFDPKPLLTKLSGQHPPESFGDADFQDGKFRNTILLA